VNLFHRIQAAYRERRSAIAIKAAPWLISKSLYRARAWLRRAGNVRILVDNSVLAYAITHETLWISTGPKKWGGVHEFDSGYAARVPVYSPQNKQRVYQEIQFLPGITELAREGLLQCMRSAELEAERLRQPAGRFLGYGCWDLNLFRGIEMESVDGLYFDTEDPVAQQQRRLSFVTDPLFLDLSKLLGVKNNLDAFHVYTAEKHGLFCFLTMDFRLCNAIKNNAQRHPIKSLKTKILTPAELGKLIGVMPVHPILLSFEGPHFFVRPDLNSPDQKRRRPKA
jgi:hypothetical protein